jgi:acetyltransferase-like isoleucine patch superfamily enzyme
MAFRPFLHRLRGARIGRNAGVTIGEGSVIKGGSVVTRSVPPWTFWGSPACDRRTD